MPSSKPRTENDGSAAAAPGDFARMTNNSPRPERGFDRNDAPLGDSNLDEISSLSSETGSERSLRPEKSVFSKTGVDSPTESSSQLERLLSRIPGLVFELDAAGTVLFANEAIGEATGYSPDELRGNNWWSVFYPGERSGEGDELNAQLAMEDLTRRETVLIAKDGRDVVVELNTANRWNADGSLQSVLGFATDVTRRAQVEAERERLCSQEALQRSEQQVRLLLNSTAEGIYGIDMDGVCTLCNAAAVQLLGYGSVDDLLGKPLHPLVHPANGESSYRGECSIGIALRREEGIHRDDEVFWRLNGSSFPVEYWSHPIDNGEQVVGAVVTFVDITQRKLMEEKLRESEERFRTLSDSSPVGIYQTDLGGRCVYTNARWQRIAGLTLDQSLGDGWVKAVHPEDRDEVFSYWLLCVFEAREFSREFRFLLPDGETRWVDNRTAVMRSDSGEAIGYVGTIEDITERKRSEVELTNAQRRLQEVLESSPAVIYSLAIEQQRFRSTWVSDNIRRIMGYDPEESLGDGWWARGVHPDDLSSELEQWHTAMATGGRVAEYRFRHKDGGYRWIRDELRILRDSAGAPTQCVGSWSDISARKNLEEQLRQAQKMEAIGRLAGGVAHDFNNLLTVITGYSDFLLKCVTEDYGVHEMVQEIHKAGDRAAALTRQLLAFSRRQVLAPVRLDLNVTIAEMEKMLRRLIGEDVSLVTILEPTLPMIEADQGQIEQVVMNLAVNARDAMPTGGVLLIESRPIQIDDRYTQTHPEIKAGRYAQLLVRDTGCGMDKATLHRVFEPFFTTKELGKGTGLGLATVYGIIKQSGGHIEVESDVGAGTTFTIYLPVATADEAEVKINDDPHEPASPNETILVVEDEDAVRNLVCQILRMSGFHVLEAPNAVEALKLEEGFAEPIHLMVTDVVMPRMSGRQLAEQIAVHRPHTKVLYVSGYTDDAIVHHGVHSSGVAFLQKPFSPDVLLRKVRETLDQ